MVCTRGQATPTALTKYRLFADSGGFCQLGCDAELFRTDTSQPISIGEFAHVIAASDRGPRAVPKATADERRAYANIILLCPTCHAVVDKAPDDYPIEELLARKRKHRAAVRRGVDQRFETRAEGRARLQWLMQENRAIWMEFGPEASQAHDPESPKAAAWKRHALTTIIPNNQAIDELLETNAFLLSDDEKEAAARFRVHMSDFAARHLEDSSIAGSRFPADIEDCFA